MWIFRSIVVIVLLVALEFYFFYKIKKSVNFLFPDIPQKRFKRILLSVLGFYNLYPLFGLVYLAYYLITGSAQFINTENIFFDIFILYPFWIGLAVIVQSLIYFIIIDLLKLVLFPVYRKHKEQLKSKEAKTIILLTLIFIVYVPARVIYDKNTIEITEHNYLLENLPDQLNGFRVVLIGDVQADRFTGPAKLGEYISKINNLKPDLVLIAGDVITSSPDYINLSAEYLGKIKAPRGVLACVGDHDNWAYRGNHNRSLSEVKAALDSVNIPMIDNDNVTLDVDGARIGITFITDNYVVRIPPQRLDSLAGANHLDFKIFLTHQPNQRMVDKAIEYNYNLFFAGHTHGGQVSFLFPFLNLSPSMFETRYVEGAFKFENMLMLVNRGLGVSIAPIRYNATPEISLIDLKRAD